MPSVKDILDNIPPGAVGDGDDLDVISDPDYLLHSAPVIADALQRGFDVLQLANGDIVTTGTKVVITQFQWDGEKGEMVKLSERERKRRNSKEEHPKVKK